MIELIISEFVTITLTILRGVSRTNVTKNCILDVAEVPEPSLLLQLLFLGSEKNINMCFVKLIFRKFEKILRKVFSKRCLLQSFRLLANLLKLDFFKRFPKEISEILKQQLFSVTFTGHAKINPTNKIIKNTR